MIKVIFYIYCLINGITTFVAAANFLTAPRLNKKVNKAFVKKASVCIPARNEEQNIKNIINDVLNQTYKNIETVILDDNSDDNTYKTAASIAGKNKKITILTGKALSPGWTGKNWACHQLSQKAKGAILFFIDADVRLSEWAIESAMAFMNKYSLSMLTVFPAQRMVSFSEKLIVPVMDWILLTFLPLKLVYLSGWLSFVAANGQFIAITREAYKKIGGHRSVSDMYVEDMELARNIKKQKLKMMTFTGNNGVSCRMYKNYSGAFNGFAKNFFPGFNTGYINFSFMLLSLNFLYLLPFILLIFYREFAVIILLIILQRIFIALTNKQNPIINIILHPLQMIIMTSVGINSMYKSKTGKLKWKGRQL
jgi:glycosyltransferase involved in cell wall biosynthesis